MNVRYTLKELGEWAVNEIGFCVGVYWTSVTGSRVPEGMLSANCRLAYVLFTGFAPAYRFYALLGRRQADQLPAATSASFKWSAPASGWSASPWSS